MLLLILFSIAYGSSVNAKEFALGLLFLIITDAFAALLAIKKIFGGARVR
jgi:hypothetical protein